MIAALLATALLVGITTHPAKAASGACASLTPAGSYAYPNFGNTLATPTIRGSVIPVCDNGALGYVSGKYNAYGMAFQCVELVRRYANVVFGSPTNGWGGDAKRSSTTHPSGWTAHQEGTTYRPVPGDIIVWGPVDGSGNPSPGASGYPGHVAIISAVTTVDLHNWNVTAVNQNWKGSTSLVAYSSGSIYKDFDGTFYLYITGTVSGSQLYGVLHHA
jgi:hypothetical protein